MKTPRIVFMFTMAYSCQAKTSLGAENIIKPSEKRAQIAITGLCRAEIARESHSRILWDRIKLLYLFSLFSAVQSLSNRTRPC